jgi:tungstate transport system ATP-binding protein
LQNLTIQRGSKTVLEVPRLDIQRGETLAVIGPNGAGKSTLLLALARLIPLASGQAEFDGQPFSALNTLAYRRRIALVLQEPLLFDRSVADNVAIGLRFRGAPKAKVAVQVQTWLKRLDIAHLADRPARRLSGGEAQRASLARALALEPELLLLDEPFSALDAPTRQRLLEDLHLLLEHEAITTVFVTHDQDEAMLLGDRVAVILAGSLRQVGSPQEVFNNPADEQVAAFVGVETVIPGIVFSTQDGQITLRAAGGSVTLYAVGSAQPGQAMLLCLRPEDITLWRGNSLPASSARNQLPGRILRLLPSGPLVRVMLDCDVPVTALVTRHSVDEMGLAAGLEVTATFKASAAHLIKR